MKTTKRSKMLLSSIAMLLVALVALGSATYAWYAINKTVTADGISVQASSVGGLQIQSDDATSTTWGNSISFSDSSVILDPAEIAVSTAGAVTAQTGSHDGATNEVGNPALAAATNGTYNYYISHPIKVKNTDKTAISATPTITWGTANTAFYVAALYEKVSGSYTLVSEVAVAGSRVTGQTAYAGQASSATSFTQDTVHEYILVVYADGWNSNCTADNGNANSSAATAVSVTWA